MHADTPTDTHKDPYKPEINPHHGCADKHVLKLSPPSPALSFSTRPTPAQRLVKQRSALLRTSFFSLLLFVLSWLAICLEMNYLAGFTGEAEWNKLPKAKELQSSLGGKVEEWKGRVGEGSEVTRGKEKRVNRSCDWDAGSGRLKDWITDCVRQAIKTASSYLGLIVMGAGCVHFSMPKQRFLWSLQTSHSSRLNANVIISIHNIWSKDCKLV